MAKGARESTAPMLRYRIGVDVGMLPGFLCTSNSFSVSTFLGSFVPYSSGWVSFMLFAQSSYRCNFILCFFISKPLAVAINIVQAALIPTLLWLLTTRI
jgi:hypothetical protein